MVQSGLVGWWPLHEWSGRANDLSGNGNHGTNNSVTRGVAGKNSLTASSFDGSNSYFSISDIPTSIETSHTISLWMRADSLPNSENYFFRSRGGGTDVINFIINDNNKIRAYVDSSGGGTLLSNRTYQTKKWYHVVQWWDGNTLAIYVNGELDATRSATGNLTNSPETAQISEVGGPFSGTLFGVRVYNRALSPSEIQHLYQVGSADVATPPGAADSGAVSRWAFDNRSDTSTALDEWGANDGTINGAVYDSDSIRGLSMNFTASNSEYITVPGGTFSSFDPTSDWSLSVWLKPVSTGTAFILDPKDDWDYQFLYDDSGNQQIKFVTYDGTNAETISTTHALNTGSWYNFTLSYDGRREFVDLYLNGIQSNSGTVQTDTVTSDTTNTIGSHSNQSQNFFDGLMDEFRVYSRALSDYEVQQLYQWGTMGVDRRHEVLRQ